MKAKATPKATKTSRSKRTSKKSSSALSNCPINGAGWCPYPFSIDQLRKKLNRLAEQTNSEESGTKELVKGKAR